jgi:hypothetical protein
MEDWLLIQNFYHGLVPLDRSHLDAAACGGINPYTLRARLGPEGLAHQKIARGPVDLLGVHAKKESKLGDQARSWSVRIGILI